MTCKNDGCNNTVHVQKEQLCKNHYQMFRYYLYRPKKKTTEERFWQYVNKTDTCWIWFGAQNGKGYGSFRTGATHVLPHRFSYELLVGPIPAGLQIDHLCFTPRCVNPKHLEPVTNKINCSRRRKKVL